MVCEAVSDYICNMKIYAARQKKLENTVLSLSDRNLGQNHRIYLDSLYNRLRIAETLLDWKARVCGTMRAKRDTPPYLKQEANHLKNGQSVFQSKDNVTVQMWKGKRLVQMISTIHDATIVNTGRKDRKTNLDIKKPYADVQYNKFMKGINGAD
jgi:hypothetical protein